MARIIADGIMNKYGLKVAVLRPLVVSAQYHCIELELQTQKSAKKLKAVWVGEEEYSQYRSGEAGQADPFAEWLAEAGSHQIPRQRQPWERKGWLSKAATWIEHELDRRNIQVTGSVEQHKVWSASAVLRVNTSMGQYYFKASYGAPPNEALLTMALAKRWPDFVPQPVSFNSSQDWLLMEDYGLDGGQPFQTGDYSMLVRQLAEVQIASAEELGDWAALGCQSQGLEHLEEFLANINRLTAVLQSGDTGLSEEELISLNSRIIQFHNTCRQLKDYSIPSTLVHPDFSVRNLARSGAGIKVFDWADTVISFPFCSVPEFMRSTGINPVTRQASSGGSGVNETSEEIINAYLEPFSSFELPHRLREAFALSMQLVDAWRLLRWSGQLAYIEPGSVSFRIRASTMQGLCRKLLETEVSQDGHKL